MSKYSQVAEIKIAGQFLGFLVEDGYKIKYLRLGTDRGEFWWKPVKELRPILDGYLNLGDAIEVSGERKLDLKTGKLKLKAYEVKRQGEPESRGIKEETQRELLTENPTINKNTSILICQKSDCQKRGGKAICEALEAGLRDRNLSTQVKIKGTGCLKQCKAGPNVVFLPDKTRYSRVSPAEIPAMIAKHFPVSG
jgi:(2Fe-2S) ferredoxin